VQQKITKTLSRLWHPWNRRQPSRFDDRTQSVTRSHFLRQAIERNLRHYQRVERAIFARIYQQGMS